MRDELHEPTRPKLWLAIFVALAALLPVPFYMVAWGRTPLLYLVEVVGLILAAIAAEGLGALTGLMLKLGLAQIGVQVLLLAALAWIIDRVLHRLAPASAGRIALAGFAGLLFVGLVWPIYVAPFSQIATRTNLVGVYRWPDLTPVAEPEVAPFEAPAQASPREPCAHRDPLRQPLWGDTHVHTALSFDAVGQGTRNRPADAYRFAKGEPVGLQPYDREGRPSMQIRLRRPLDFAVVSDHAELLGETRMCKVPGLPGHDGVLCQLVRGWTRLGYGLVNGDVFSRWPPRRYGFCGEDGERCVEAADLPWAEIQRAADEAYDRSSACAFTSFVGFEWSAMPGSFNAHRNVVFRSEVVPARPINYIDTPTQEGLWQELERRCIDAGTGCDALAIPHNSNVSNGRMFTVETAEGRPIDAAAARRRSLREPLVEITQHKGDSECRAPSGPTADEYCAFETPTGATMAEIMMGIENEPAPLTFVREVLAEGVAQQQRIGANPFKLGVIGSTDTHYGTPGLVDERTFVGHAAGMVSRLVEVPIMPDLGVLNPGGLAAVWAEENTRESIFDAMARRETFGTSGPRMTVRFFGGWDLDDDLCEREDFVAQGYARGVPMGGDLVADGAAVSAPALAIRARRDPGVAGAPGADLERLQVVKVWVEEGAPREAVFDVAVEAPADGAGVDLDTCTPRGAGADELCAVWRDPGFDPAVPAAWYVRVLEEPTCRWTQWLCVDRGVDCDAPSSVPDELAHCCDDTVPATIRERAWASPIWYTPAP